MCKFAHVSKFSPYEWGFSLEYQVTLAFETHLSPKLAYVPSLMEKCLFIKRESLFLVILVFSARTPTDIMDS